MLKALPAGFAFEITIFPILFITLKIGKGTIEILQKFHSKQFIAVKCFAKSCTGKKKYTKKRNSNFVAITLFSIFALC